MGISNKVAIVTGGATGLGRVYSERIAEEGGRVVVADKARELGEHLVEELRSRHGKDRALAVEVDVTSRDDSRRMVSATVEAFGQVDLLLNNAGTYPHENFEDITEKSWRMVMATNLDGVFHCSQAVVPVMRAARQGAIINIASNLVWGGLAGMVHYVAAKAGVVGLTRALAREVGPYGIRVNAVAPGAVPPSLDTLPSAALATVEGIVAWQCIPRPERADDLVGAVLFLASDDSAFVSGQVLTVDGGLTMH